MAAVQLGIPKRLIYVKNTDLDKVNQAQYNIGRENNDYDEAKVLINPVAIRREGLTTYWEACASCLDTMGLVRRPYLLELEYLDEQGSKQRQIFKGFEATVVSHEFDHLNGVLHMDIALEVKNMTREERAIFRQTHGYEVIAKEGNYEELLKQKTLIK